METILGRISLHLVEIIGGNKVKTYKAQVRMSSGRVVEIKIQAKNSIEAKDMLESQYGKGSIFTGLIEGR